MKPTTCAHKDGRYFAHTDPTEARIVSTIKQGLQPDDVSEQLTIVARKVVSHNSQTFQVAQDVSTPEHIPDRTGRPLLAIIRLDADQIDATEMVTSAAVGQPRLEQNNVFMLFPETVQVAGDIWSEERVKKSRYRKERLNDLARTVIAMRRLQNRPEDYGMSAGKLQGSGFTAKLKERELALQTSVAQAYDTILFPGASGQVTKKSIKQAGGEGGASVDEEIHRVLAEEGELVTAEAAGAQAMLLQLGQLFFDSIGQTPSIDRIRDQFNQNRRWPILDNSCVLEHIIRSGVEKGQWCIYRMDSSKSTMPEQFHSRETGGAPLDLNLSESGWKLVSEPGAIQRGWNPEAEPDVEQVKPWVEGVMMGESCATVKDVINQVREQHGSVKNATVLNAIDNVVQSGRLYTYEPPEEGGDENPNLLYGSGAMFHQAGEDDMLVTPATAAEKGWVTAEDSRYSKQGHGLAVALHQQLNKISSLYSRGATTQAETLRLAMLELPHGGKLNLDLIDATPQDMKALGELFEILAELTSIGDDSFASITIQQQPEECAFLNLVKQADA